MTIHSSLRTSAGLVQVAEADLPSGHAGAMMRVHAFRDADGIEHLALVKRPFPNSPLVRLHSECLTGDALGSLRCDCGAQLQEALRIIGLTGGIVLYLRGHEGRGIGLANKIKAYALQDHGLDTVEANHALGFNEDSRDYAVAACMLHSLEVDEADLLTNNPAKVLAMKDAGVTINRVVPLVVPSNTYSVRYLETKRDKMGHGILNVVRPLQSKTMVTGTFD